MGEQRGNEECDQDTRHINQDKACHNRNTFRNHGLGRHGHDHVPVRIFYAVKAGVYVLPQNPL